MKRAHSLLCGGRLVVLLVAGVPAASAQLIAALLACPLMMLIMLRDDRQQLGQSPAQVTSQLLKVFAQPDTSR